METGRETKNECSLVEREVENSVSDSMFCWRWRLWRDGRVAIVTAPLFIIASRQDRGRRATGSNASSPLSFSLSLSLSSVHS